MGTHGAFDQLTLSICRTMRTKYNNIDIEVVITSLHATEKDCYNALPYSDVQTVMYDIENAHFKQQITLSNRKMIDTCDTLICYVNEKVCNSGAKTAMNYAKKKGLNIINLFREADKL